MSRRTGQSGTVLKRGDRFYGRFWIDTPDGRKQQTIVLGQLPNKTTARQRLREHIEKTGVNAKEQFLRVSGATFKEQSAVWLDRLSTRTRRPVKPKTLETWQQTLDKWVLPNIGEMMLADVHNGVLRDLVHKMQSAHLAAKTIVNHSQVVKMVVASAVDKNGDQLYPRKWNHEFCDMPIVDKTKQARPTITTAEAETLLKNLSEPYRIMVALLLVSGLRIGEALGLKVEDFGEGCQTVHISRSLWKLNEQTPKTPNAVRVVDIPSEFAAHLAAHIEGKTGLLFTGPTGKPLLQRSVLRVLHDAGAQHGFHAFRRFRDETLQVAETPGDLINQWLGWAGEGMAALYGEGLKRNEARRRKYCERAGLGFRLVSHVSQNDAAIGVANAA